MRNAVRALFLGAALTAGCGIDGSGVIQGRDANTKLLTALIVRGGACGVTWGSVPFNVGLLIPVPFVEDDYYSTKDVDRCIDDFHRIPCDFLRTRVAGTFSTTNFDLVAPLVCRNVSSNNVIEAPYLQGILIKGSGSDSDSEE